MSGEERLAGMQRFNRPRWARSGPYSAPFSVTAGGLLSMSDAIYASLGRPPRVALYYDGGTGEFAVVPDAIDPRNTCSVYRIFKRWMISTPEFCRMLGILGAARPLEAQIEEGILFAQTKEPTP